MLASTLTLSVNMVQGMGKDNASVNIYGFQACHGCVVISSLCSHIFELSDITRDANWHSFYNSINVVYFQTDLFYLMCQSDLLTLIAMKFDEQFCSR